MPSDRKQDVSDTVSSPFHWLFGGSSSSTVVAVLLLLVALTAVSMLLWRKYGATILAHPKYQITAESFDVTEPPAWIHSDVKHEIITAGGLTELNIGSPETAPRIAAAFALHPWVEKVVNVGKRSPGGRQRPTRVVVRLVYRKPVAMVAVSGGVIPVDRDGVTLPTLTDFTSEQVSRYPIIHAKDAAAIAAAGAKWGDERVHASARLADFLSPYWEELNLRRIVAFKGVQDGRGISSPTLHLQTRSKTTILWGHAPGDESPGEAKAETKISRLAALYEETGTLDSIEPGRAIDLRHSDRIVLAHLPDETTVK